MKHNSKKKSVMVANLMIVGGLLSLASSLISNAFATPPAGAGDYRMTLDSFIMAAEKKSDFLQEKNKYFNNEKRLQALASWRAANDAITAQDQLIFKTSDLDLLKKEMSDLTHSLKMSTDRPECMTNPTTSPFTWKQVPVFVKMDSPLYQQSSPNLQSLMMDYDNLYSIYYSLRVVDANEEILPFVKKYCLGPINHLQKWHETLQTKYRPQILSWREKIEKAASDLARNADYQKALQDRKRLSLQISEQRQTAFEQENGMDPFIESVWANKTDKKAFGLLRNVSLPYGGNDLKRQAELLRSFRHGDEAKAMSSGSSRQLLTLLYQKNHQDWPGVLAGLKKAQNNYQSKEGLSKLVKNLTYGETIAKKPLSTKEKMFLVYFQRYCLDDKKFNAEMCRKSFNYENGLLYSADAQENFSKMKLREVELGRVIAACKNAPTSLMSSLQRVSRLKDGIAKVFHRKAKQVQVTKEEKIEKSDEEGTLQVRDATDEERAEFMAGLLGGVGVEAAPSVAPVETTVPVVAEVNTVAKKERPSKEWIKMNLPQKPLPALPIAEVAPVEVAIPAPVVVPVSEPTPAPVSIPAPASTASIIWQTLGDYLLSMSA